MQIVLCRGHFPARGPGLEQLFRQQLQQPQDPTLIPAFLAKGGGTAPLLEARNRLLLAAGRHSE